MDLNVRNNGGNFAGSKVRNRAAVVNFPRSALKALVPKATAQLLDSLGHEDLQALGNFLVTGEYHPILIASRGGRLPLKPHISTPGMVIQYLEGLESMRDYDEQLNRSVWMYLIACRVQLPRLKALAVHKIRVIFPYLDSTQVRAFINWGFIRADKDLRGAYDSQDRNVHPFHSKYRPEKEPIRVFCLDYLAYKLGSLTITSNLLPILKEYPDVKANMFLRAARQLFDQIPNWYYDPEARRNPQWRWNICARV